MLFMILLNLILAPATLTAVPTGPTAVPGNAGEPFAAAQSNKDCPSVSPRIADEHGKGAPLRRLDQLPPGRLELAVMREINGCVIPAVVREGIGGNAREDDGRR